LLLESNQTNGTDLKFHVDPNHLENDNLKVIFHVSNV